MLPEAGLLGAGDSPRIAMRARPRMIASALAASSSFTCGRGMPTRAQARPPDFVNILTDDMRDADWQALARTEALFGRLGTTFPNVFCATPLCTPSRVSLLTGRYSHNLRQHLHVEKTTHYDHANGVTMLACGPGFAPGAVAERLASIVDLAPTMAETARFDLPDAEAPAATLAARLHELRDCAGVTWR